MNQLIQAIPILSDSELTEINSFIDSRLDSLQTSRVWVDNETGEATVDESFRTSTGFGLETTDTIEPILHKAMERGLQEYRNRLQKINLMFNYWPVPGSPETFCGREGIQILSYKPGQKYVFHHDQSDWQDRPEYFRTISTVLYLNEDFLGGGTEFPHKIFKPKPGIALFFPSNWCYPHSGQEVISGEKRVAVTWWYSVREKEG